MGEASRYPIDFDALGKGDVLSAETIVGIVGVSAGSARYSGRQMRLCARIERELTDRGLDVTVACVKTEIHVLDDAAAAVHTKELFRKGLQTLRRAHGQNMKVDAGQLSAAERKDHERALVVQGAIVAGIREARRNIAVAYQRKTPGLPRPETAGRESGEPVEARLGWAGLGTAGQG